MSLFTNYKCQTLHTTKNPSFPPQLPLNLWAGVEQMATPHLVETYKQRLSDVAPWLQESVGTAFAVIISVLGERIPVGLWRFLSSPAFLGTNNWFIIFSGGMLNPRTLRLKVRTLRLNS